MGFIDRYLIFNKNAIPWVKNSLGTPKRKLSPAKDYHGNSEIIALLDTPRSQFKSSATLESKYHQPYLRFLFDELPISNLPSRGVFGKVLEYIYTHPNLTIDDYQVVSSYLGLDYQAILFILRVSFELRFVSFIDGKIVDNKDSESRKLTASRYPTNVAPQIKLKNQLRTIPNDQLTSYVKQYLK